MSSRDCPTDCCCQPGVVETAIADAQEQSGGFARRAILIALGIINDSLGHPFGDRVLQLVAERLQTCLRQTDMLCRLGGDEFVIYLHGECHGG